MVPVKQPTFRRVEVHGPVVQCCRRVSPKWNRWFNGESPAGAYLPRGRACKVESLTPPRAQHNNATNKSMFTAPAHLVVVLSGISALTLVLDSLEQINIQRASTTVAAAVAVARPEQLQPGQAPFRHVENRPGTATTASAGRRRGRNRQNLVPAFGVLRDHRCRCGTTAVGRRGHRRRRVGGCRALEPFAPNKGEAPGV